MVKEILKEQKTLGQNVWVAVAQREQNLAARIIDALPHHHSCAYGWYVRQPDRRSFVVLPHYLFALT